MRIELGQYSEDALRLVSLASGVRGATSFLFEAIRGELERRANGQASQGVDLADVVANSEQRQRALGIFQEYIENFRRCRNYDAAREGLGLFEVMVLVLYEPQGRIQ